jgi:hypothetical protein
MSTASRPPISEARNRIIDPWAVWVPAPEDRSLAVRLFVARTLLTDLKKDRRATSFAHYYGHIHGKCAYADESGARTTVDTGGLLSGATALFRGLQREMFAPGVDERVYVYISRPEHDYVRTKEQTLPVRIGVPTLSVFTTFALIGQEAVSALNDDLRNYYGGTEADGILIGWQWTTTSTADPTLPVEPDSRYQSRIW